MCPRIRARARGVAALAVIAGSLACGSDGPSAAAALTGTYTATTFQVTPDGQPLIDVLAKGGSLSITFAANDAVSGTVFLPSAVTGAGDFTAAMSGTVVHNGGTVQFQQSVDSFVRDLTWTVGTNTLTVTNQHAGTAAFTITLTRQ